MAHLLLDLSIGSLHNNLLPSSSGGSGVLLHSASGDKGTALILRTLD